MAAVVPLCHGCLSADRVLSPIGEFKTIYTRICTVKIASSIKDTNLCWECTATLKRMQTFKKQVNEAQNKLRLFIRKKDNLLPKSLSKLNTSITNYDFISITEKEIEIKKEDDSYFSDAHNDEEDLQEDPTSIDDLKDIEQCVTESKIKIKNEDDSDFSDAPNEEDKLKQDPTLIVDLKDLKEKPQNQRLRYYDHISTAEEMCVKEQAGQSDLVHLRERDGRDPQGSDASGTVCMESEDYLKVEFNKNENIETYKSNHNERKPHVCNLCHACYGTLEELSSHVTSHDVYRCLVCGHRSPSLEEARRHVTQHRKIVKCRICDYCCRTVQEFREHYKIAHKQFWCDHCGKNFTSKRKLEIHISAHHTVHCCKKCKRTYRTKYSLVVHIKSVHDVCKTEETFCVECNTQFKNHFRFKIHLRYKHGDQFGRPSKKKPFKCLEPGCDKTYSKRYYMMCHYRYVHQGRSQFYCSICDKYFLRFANYKEHCRHKHEGVQKIQKKRDKLCGVCGRGFTCNQILTNHMRTHTGERPFACALCDARFAQKTARDMHQKRHCKQN